MTIPRQIAKSTLTLLAIASAFYLGRLTVGEPSDQTNEPVVEAALQLPEEPVSLDPIESSDLVVERSFANVRNADEAEALRERLLAWAEEDPNAALQFAVEELHPLPQREMALTAILAEWAAREPAKAWHWAKENSPNDLVGLLFEIGKIEPEMAWANANEYVQGRPDHSYMAYMSALGGVIHNGDYVKGVELMEGLDLPFTIDTKNGKYSFLTPVIAEWVRYSPEEVAEWITALPDADNSAKKSLAHDALLSHWSYSDPVATLDYAANLPENQAKFMSVNTALQALADRQDFDVATEWLNKNASGPEYDSYIHTLATNEQMMAEHPEIAIGWAESITTPRVREESLVSIAATTYRKDPDSAIELFSEQLPQETWNEVLALVGRMENAKYDTLHGDHGEGRTDASSN